MRYLPWGAMVDIEFFCQFGKIIVSTILKIDGRITKYVGLTIFIILIIWICWEQPIFIYCTICSIIWIFTLGNWTTKSFWFKTYILYMCQFLNLFMGNIWLRITLLFISYLKMRRSKQKFQQPQLVAIVIQYVEFAMDQVHPILPKCHHNSFFVWIVFFEVCCCFFSY